MLIANPIYDVVFDTKHSHSLNFPDHAISPALKVFTKRLLQAQLNEEMEAIMLLDKAAELEQALLDKEKALLDKEEERMAKEKERAAKEKALRENEKVNREKERLIKILKQQ